MENKNILASQANPAGGPAAAPTTAPAPMTAAAVPVVAAAPATSHAPTAADPVVAHAPATSHAPTAADPVVAQALSGIAGAGAIGGSAGAHASAGPGANVGGTQVGGNSAGGGSGGVPVGPGHGVPTGQPDGGKPSGDGRFAFLKSKKFRMWAGIAGIALVVVGTASVILTRQTGLYRATLDQNVSEQLQGNFFRAGEGGTVEECSRITLQFKGWRPRELGGFASRLSSLYDTPEITAAWIQRTFTGKHPREFFIIGFGVSGSVAERVIDGLATSHPDIVVEPRLPAGCNEGCVNDDECDAGKTCQAFGQNAHLCLPADDGAGGAEVADAVPADVADGDDEDDGDPPPPPADADVADDDAPAEVRISLTAEGGFTAPADYRYAIGTALVFHNAAAEERVLTIQRNDSVVHTETLAANGDFSFSPDRYGDYRFSFEFSVDGETRDTAIGRTFYRTLNDEAFCGLMRTFATDLNTQNLDESVYTLFYSYFNIAHVERPCPGVAFPLPAPGNTPACDSLFSVLRTFDTAKMDKRAVKAFYDGLKDGNNVLAACELPEDLNYLDDESSVETIPACLAASFSYGAALESRRAFLPAYANSYETLWNFAEQNSCSIPDWSKYSRFADVETNICELGPVIVDAMNATGVSGGLYDILYEQLQGLYAKRRCAEPFPEDTLRDAPACEAYTKFMQLAYDLEVPRHAFTFVRGLVHGDDDLIGFDGKPYDPDPEELQQMRLLFAPYKRCALPESLNPATLPDMPIDGYISNVCSFDAIVTETANRYGLSDHPKVRELFGALQELTADECRPGAEDPPRPVLGGDGDGDGDDGGGDDGGAPSCRVATLVIDLLKASNLKGPSLDGVVTYFRTKATDAGCANVTELTRPLPEDARASNAAQCANVTALERAARASGASEARYNALSAEFLASGAGLACAAGGAGGGAGAAGGGQASLWTRLLGFFGFGESAHAQAAPVACNSNFYIVLGLLNDARAGMARADYEASYNLLKDAALADAGGACDFPDILPPAALDGDGDGIADADDACPAQVGVANANPARNGCPAAPPADRDGDGIADADDACPAQAGVANAVPAKNGCPVAPPADPLAAECQAIIDAVDAISTTDIQEYNDLYAEQLINAAEMKRLKNYDCEIPEPDEPTPGGGGTPASECTASELQNMTTLLNVLNSGSLAGAAYMTQYNQLKAQATGIGCTLPAPPAGRDQEPVLDKDADGIADATDACPDQKGVANAVPAKNGCPVAPAAVTPPAGNLALTDPVVPSAPPVSNAGVVTPAGGGAAPATGAGGARPAVGAGAYGAVVPQPVYQPAYQPAQPVYGTPNLAGAAPQQPVYTYGNQIGGDTGPGALAYLVIPGLANVAWFARRAKRKRTK